MTVRDEPHDAPPATASPAPSAHLEIGAGVGGALSGIRSSGVPRGDDERRAAVVATLDRHRGLGRSALVGRRGDDCRRPGPHVAPGRGSRRMPPLRQLLRVCRRDGRGPSRGSVRSPRHVERKHDRRPGRGPGWRGSPNHVLALRARLRRPPRRPTPAHRAGGRPVLWQASPVAAASQLGLALRIP